MSERVYIEGMKMPSCCAECRLTYKVRTQSGPPADVCFWLFPYGMVCRREKPCGRLSAKRGRRIMIITDTYKKARRRQRRRPIGTVTMLEREEEINCMRRSVEMKESMREYEEHVKALLRGQR